MEWLNEFFKNPSWIGLIAVGMVLIFFYLRDVKKQKKENNEKEIQQKKETEKENRREHYYQIVDRSTDAIELLINNNTNKVNLMQAENIISRTLYSSKAIIEREIRRIFEHNHRENSNRQKIIKQSLVNVTMNVFENDIKMLSQLYYKHKSLSEFLLNLDTEKFFNELIKLVFTTGGIAENELRDIIAFIDSEFDMFILNGKKYYNNL